jgi:hypothetical protein
MSKSLQKITHGVSNTIIINQKFIYSLVSHNNELVSLKNNHYVAKNFNKFKNYFSNVFSKIKHNGYEHIFDFVF